MSQSEAKAVYKLFVIVFQIDEAFASQAHIWVFILEHVASGGE